MLKNTFPVKCAVLLTGYIQEIISGYHLVVKQLQCRLKKDNTQNYHPN
jgi:hypothetical protein